MLITPKNKVDLFKHYLPNNPIIVEAGAFKGNDTLQLAKHFPAGTVHAFEPVPAIFGQLRSATQAVPNIITYNYALSTHTGSTIFYVAQNPKRPDVVCQAGSLCQPKERLIHSPITYPTTIEVATITLDAWAQHYQYNRIDFLWLDTQGHELAIMQASPHILAQVKLIYLEVHFIEAYQEQPPYSYVHAWLEKQGFTCIGKDFENEHTWFFGNALYARI
jgi:FkbM family methyltransferase